MAGPGVNLVLLLLLTPLAILLFVLGSHETWGGQYVLCMAGANLVLMLFNLLPIFPMDGGRVLRAILSSWLDRLRATSVAASIGLLMAGGLAMLGIWWGNPGLVLVAVFVAIAGQAELAALRRQAAMEAERARAERAVITYAWNPILGAWVPRSRPAA